MYNIKIVNTGELIVLDEQDFHKAKRVRWYRVSKGGRLDKKQARFGGPAKIQNEAGVTLLEYLGLGDYKNKLGRDYDVRRCQLIKKNEVFVYSTFFGGYVVIDRNNLDKLC